MKKFTAISRLFFGSFLITSFVGCAVQTLPGGNLQVGIDNAELLGQTVASFRLGDGSEGRLRVFGGKYSVKLQKQFKVVDIVNATMVRVVSAAEVGGRTLLVLEKSEANCNFKTHLLSIRGAEVLSWDFGDCRSQPIAAITTDQATFDFVQQQRTTRFTYRDARLTRGEFQSPPPGYTPNAQAPISVDTGGPRYVPGPPVGATNSTAKAVSKPVFTPASSSDRVAAAPAAPQNVKSMDFSVQEQKPVRIVLDK